MRKKILIAAALALAATGAQLARSQTPDPLDPIRVAPDTHKLAFENQFVRVLDVRVLAGKTEPRHRHPRGMSVYFTDWDARVTVDGGKPEVRHRAPERSPGATPSSIRWRTWARQRGTSCASS